MYVYVAGPYTKGDVVLNVRRAIEAANIVLSEGHVPFLPHITMLWHLVTPKPYEDWLEIDLAWIKKCDMLLRLSGDSSGADGEAAYAKKLDKPVVHAINLDAIPAALVRAEELLRPAL